MSQERKIPDSLFCQRDCPADYLIGVRGAFFFFAQKSVLQYLDFTVSFPEADFELYGAEIKSSMINE